MEDNERQPADDLLDRVEELIEKGEIKTAQSLLDGADCGGGRKYYIQSKIFAKKGWRTEQRKQLEFALKAEPDNSVYKKALDRLTESENTPLTDEQYFELVEAHLNLSEPDFAQNDLNCVKCDSGRKYYLQSLIYKQKKWYNEQYKQLKKAVKAEPENEGYKKELAELKEFKKSGEYRQYKKQIGKRQMGDFGGACAEGCGEGAVVCCCEGICEGICNGS